MSRCMQDLYGVIAEPEHFAVGSKMDGKVCLGMWAIDDRGAGRLGEVEMTAYKIGMEMCFEDISDPGLTFFGQLQVDIDITQGVNDGCFTIAFEIVCSLA